MFILLYSFKSEKFVSNILNLKNKNAKSTLIHPLIFFMFPIVFLFSKNTDADLGPILQLSLLFMLITFSLWLIMGYLLKNRIKSSLIISFWAGLFFSYGHTHTSLSSFLNIDINTMFVIITFLIYVILWITFPLFVIKTKRTLDNITKIITFASLVVIILPFVGIAQSEILENNYSLEMDFKGNPTLSTSDISTSYSPDVYYIILDEYAGSESLETLWHFDNSNFENFLIDHDFYIAQNSFSNYDTTAQSVPSTLNMTYVHDDAISDNTYATRKPSEISSNYPIFENFRSKNYTTYSIESGYYWDVDSPKNIDYNLCADKNILDSTFVLSIFKKSMLIPALSDLLLAENFRDNVLCVFTELHDIKNKSNTPKFVFAHVLAPHRPYVFNSTGGHPVPLIFNLGLGTTYRDVLYIDQLQFVNLKMKSIITKLLDTENPPVIIIQSDHGKRGASTHDDPSTYSLKHLNNFKAYYFPDKGRNIEFETSSPVNSFRILFNIYFDDEYEILKDRFYILDETETKYIEVTDTVINLKSND